MSHLMFLTNVGVYVSGMCFYLLGEVVLVSFLI